MEGPYPMFSNSFSPGHRPTESIRAARESRIAALSHQFASITPQRLPNVTTSNLSNPNRRSLQVTPPFLPILDHSPASARTPRTEPLARFTGPGPRTTSLHEYRHSSIRARSGVMPQWQRVQENETDLADDQLMRDGMRRTVDARHESDTAQSVETNGVMDDTPPSMGSFGRWLRD
ncbi:hypothetical protein LTS18_008538 [Coniosporium uncinatum]|uniref:Uncharacterized protein n=1 Tax=Coniosporium uncinatum TaxID=93489 RepID=A0ACC3D1H8_9PEZI|nr:hypothetical protein LTS18_008538 [Coniosporium uncinatum]